MLAPELTYNSDITVDQDYQVVLKKHSEGASKLEKTVSDTSIVAAGLDITALGAEVIVDETISSITDSGISGMSSPSNGSQNVSIEPSPL